MRKTGRMATLWLAAALVLGVSPVASLAQTATPSGSATAADDKVTFTLGVTGDLNSVNPFRAIDSTESFVFGLMYEGLLRRAQTDYTPEALMAESWSTSDDGLTWTFNLRDDMFWSDGEPITAEDFAWTGNFIANNDISSWSDGYRFTDTIEATDDHTVVWTTTRPTLVPGLPGYNLLLPEHVWGQFDDKFDLDELKSFKNFPGPVVSGPFILTEWEQGQFWKLEANPDYFGEQPIIDELIFRVYNSNESVIQALLKGAIDYTTIPTANLYDEVNGTENITTAKDSAEAFWQLSFNLADDPSSTANPAVLDETFRQAVEHAIDRDTLIERVLNGYATPGSTNIAPAYPFWHWEPPEDVRRNFDIAQANAMLDEAGYEDTDDDGVRENPDGGDPVNLRLFLSTTDPDGIKAAPFLTNWFEQIGVGRHDPDVQRQQALRGVVRLRLGPDRVLVGHRPRSRLPALRLDHEPVRVLERHVLERRRVRQALRGAADGARRGRAAGDRARDAADLLRGGPEIVLWYPNSFEGWRSDRWEGFVPWPEPDGVRFFGNQYSVMQVHPVDESSGAAASVEGASTLLWIGAGAVVLALIAVPIARRRRKGDDAYHG